MSNFESVKTFMKTFGQEVKEKAEFPNDRITSLRYDLINEELSELKEAIENKDIKIRELMKHIPGPDFPTGGVIIGKDIIKQGYNKGRGSFKIRGEITIEAQKNGRERLVINSIPYQVNKSVLNERIAQLVREKKIEGIKDIRDESNREGIRVSIDLRNGVEPETVKRQLYKNTQIESSFGFNNLAIVEGKPKIIKKDGKTIIAPGEGEVEREKELLGKLTSDSEVRAQKERESLRKGMPPGTGERPIDQSTKTGMGTETDREQTITRPTADRSKKARDDYNKFARELRRQRSRDRRAEKLKDPKFRASETLRKAKQTDIKGGSSVKRGDPVPQEVEPVKKKPVPEIGGFQRNTFKPEIMARRKTFKQAFGQPTGADPETGKTLKVDPVVAKAMNRDYSALMKAIDKKKGNVVPI